MSLQKDTQGSSAADGLLIKKLKQMVNTLQRALQVNEMKSRRQAQEIRELKTENTILKEKARRNV